MPVPETPGRRDGGDSHNPDFLPRKMKRTGSAAQTGSEDAVGKGPSPPEQADDILKMWKTIKNLTDCLQICGLKYSFFPQIQTKNSRPCLCGAVAAWNSLWRTDENCNLGLKKKQRKRENRFPGE